MKYLSKMRKLRVISMILCIAMMAMSFPMMVTALDEPLPTEEAPTTTVTNAADDSAVPKSTWTPTVAKEAPIGIGEKTLAELQTMRVEDVALPETITLETARQKGHVNRLYEQETDLQTVIFQNQSGNMTAYVYDHPVKYIDANGNVRDKDTAIAVSPLSGYAYAMTDNSVRVYFAGNATDGVMMQYGDASIIMKAEPSLLVSTVSLGDEDNVVLYNNAFGARTVLRYQTLLNGLKEDIILLSDVGKNTFNFRLSTQGVTPVEENGEWKLVNESGETVMTFSRIKINDSAGKTVYGTLDIVPAANGYTITVTAPQEFLSASDTVYPVYIDPTVQSWEYNNDTTTQEEYEAIIDQGLYATQAAADAATDSTKHNLNSETGRVIYKFSDFYRTNGRFLSYTNEYRIGRATMHVTLSAGNAGTINAMPMGTAWEPNAANLPLVDETLWYGESTARVSSTAISTAAGTYGIDITDIVRGWASYNAGKRDASAVDPSNGFVIESFFSGTRTVDAVEAGSPFDVWYTIDYSARGGIYYIISGHYGDRYLNKYSNSVANVTTATSPPADCIWLINYVGDDKYLISNAYYNGFYLNNSNSLAENSSTDYWNYPDKFYWEFDVSDTIGMLITNSATGLSLYHSASSLETRDVSQLNDSNYNFATWLLTLETSFEIMRSFSVSGISYLDQGGGYYATVSVDPPNATLANETNFVWSSSNTSVATVDANGYICALKKGVTTIAVKHKLTGKRASFLLTVGDTLPNGLYCIQNMNTNDYVTFNDIDVAPKASGYEGLGSEIYFFSMILNRKHI